MEYLHVVRRSLSLKQLSPPHKEKSQSERCVSSDWAIKIISKAGEEEKETLGLRQELYMLSLHRVRLGFQYTYHGVPGRLRGLRLSLLG